MEDKKKTVHTLCIDTNPIIRNIPSISSILAQVERIITVPDIVDEIRDAATRSRFEVTIKPFLEIRTPSVASVAAITDFARKTGDLSVLSRQDIRLLALTRDLEIERNGGDWRLRNAPGQKGTNGKRPAKDLSSSGPEASNGTHLNEETPTTAAPSVEVESSEISAPRPEAASDLIPESASVSTLQARDEGVPLLETSTDEIPPPSSAEKAEPETAGPAVIEDVTQALERTHMAPPPDEQVTNVVASTEVGVHSSDSSASESDSDGWITPSNIARRVAADESSSLSTSTPNDYIEAALLSSDFAMQNVALQMNLSLFSPSSSSLQRVTTLRSWVLRCSACFNILKDTSKHFCPRCGKPDLTRVSCSTNARGDFKLHFKRNYTHNRRGERFSIPKAVTGSSSGKVRMGEGGQGGWGKDLILAEDQKEYERAVLKQKRERKRDLMDEDVLPSILSGERHSNLGRIKIGAGRNANSKKRGGKT